MPKLGQQKPLPREKKRANAPFCLRLRVEEGEGYNCPVASTALVWDVWDPLLLSLILLVFFLVVWVAVCGAGDEGLFFFVTAFYLRLCAERWKV